MRKHLIIASYDGICTHYCGVGTIIRNTIDALGEIVCTHNLKVSLACIATDPAGEVFDSECFRASSELTLRTGGSMLHLCNGSKGYDASDMWKSFPQWHYACASLATGLGLILSNTEHNVLMLHDTPFLPFISHKKQCFGNSMQCLFLPHSTGLNHRFGNEAWRKNRVLLEMECFRKIQSDPGANVLATGISFAKHLETDYGLSFEPRHHLHNGLSLKHHDEGIRVRFDCGELSRYGISIPSDAKIIFSWGRSSVAKGFWELLNAWKMVNSMLTNHYLVLQMPNNSGEMEYYERVVKEARQIPRTWVLDDFNPAIWKSILRCNSTDIVCIPSLMDPNPHTPMEAKLYGNGMNYVILASDKDGVKDSYHDDECLRFDPSDSAQLAEQILMATRIDSTTRAQMAGRNYQSVLRRFNYTSNLKRFLVDEGLTR